MLSVTIVGDTVKKDICKVVAIPVLALLLVNLSPAQAVFSVTKIPGTSPNSLALAIRLTPAFWKDLNGILPPVRNGWVRSAAV